MNKWCFTGNLGSDCEVSVSQAQITYCSFSVATTSGWGVKEKTTWVRCILSGKRAEGDLPGCLKKGQKVAIDGELSMDEWKDKQTGEVKKGLKVWVGGLDLIGAKPAPPQEQTPAGKPQNEQQQQQQHHQAQGFAPQQQTAGFDDDIPF